MPTEDAKRKYRREWYYRNRLSIVQHPERPLKTHANSRKNLICYGCGSDFVRIASRHKDREGHRVFCTEKCYRENSRDDLSPFRFYFNRIKRSLKRGSRTLSCSLSPEILMRIWDAQNGICPYSGIQMLLPASHYRVPNSPRTASVDRIDSRLDYSEDNVEFVCRFVNIGKNSFPKHQIQQFFTSVADEKAAASKPVST